VTWSFEADRQLKIQEGQLELKIQKGGKFLLVAVIVGQLPLSRGS